MKIRVEVPILGSSEEIWKVISNIENCQNVISGIEKVEVLEKPEAGLVGFKWRETRTLFGKTATEVMWITEAESNSFYKTRAESHGSIYISQMSIREGENQSILGMEFEGKPQTFGAKFGSFVFGFLFKGATRKALLQDLTDIKEAVEKQ